jgi:transposase-like protein
MSYVTSPYAPRARREAVNLVIKDGWSAAAVARRAGVHRSTVGRWLRKAAHIHGGKFLYNQPSRPHTSPAQVVAKVLS